MKFKEKYDRSRDLSYLQLNTDKRLQLDYSKAQLLAQNERSYLVPFNFADSTNKAELYYFIDDLVPMPDYLEAGLVAGALTDIINQVVRMLSTCEDRGFAASNILLDTKYCYLHPQSGLVKFIYLPVAGYKAPNRAQRDFFIQLVSAAQPADSNAAGHILKMLDFLRGQEVFSLFKLKSYLSPQDGLEEQFFALGSNKANAHNRMPRPSGKLSHDLQRDFVLERSSDLAQANFPAGFTTSFAAASFVVTPPSLSTLVLERETDGRRWQLAEGLTELGRAPEAGLAVSHSTSVGRSHATVEVANDVFVIADKASKNGTFVQGLRLKPGVRTIVEVGSTFRLGDEQFRLVRG